MNRTLARLLLAAMITLAGDPVSHALELVNRATNYVAPLTGAGMSSGGLVSADGRQVVFSSDAPNLVTNLPAPAGMNVYRRDRHTGVTEWLTRSVAPRRVDQSIAEDITPDAATVALTSTATGLVPGDTNGAADVFVLRVADRSVTLASVRG